MTAKKQLGSRPERRDAADSRKRILAAARDLFATRGVASVGMQEIARAAGLSQGTLYRRYAHKGELCRELLGAAIMSFQQGMVAPLSVMDEPALSRLAVLLDGIIHFTESHASLLLAIDEAASGARRGSAFTHPLYIWLWETTTDLLEEAVAQGEAVPLEIDCAADLVLAPLAIDSYLHLRHDRGCSPEQISATARRLLIEGLRSRPDSNPEAVDH